MRRRNGTTRRQLLACLALPPLSLLAAASSQAEMQQRIDAGWQAYLAASARSDALGEAPVDYDAWIPALEAELRCLGRLIAMKPEAALWGIHDPRLARIN